MKQKYLSKSKYQAKKKKKNGRKREHGTLYIEVILGRLAS